MTAEKKLVDIVDVRIEGPANTGKTAMATLIEDLLQKHGMQVERILTGEGGEVDVEQSAANVRQVGARAEFHRAVKVRISERHAAARFWGVSPEDAAQALRLDAAIPGYATLSWGARLVLKIQPVWINEEGVRQSVFLDNLTPAQLKDTYFEVWLFEKWPNWNVVGRYPLSGFADLIKASYYFFLAWMQSVQLELYNTTSQKENAIALAAHARKLLDDILQSYKDATDNDAFPVEVRVKETHD